MHPTILGAALAALALATAPRLGVAAGNVPQAGAACPGPGAAVIERHLAADCTACWAEATAPAVREPAWRFDWIVPAGDEAPLSAAAVPEAAERLQRLQAQAPREQVRPLPALPGVRLAVQSGPAWNGYLGLQLDVRGRLPAGSSGWLALVEELPAGSEGSPVARQLVRAVAGPIPLLALQQRAGHSADLRALRWPEGAQVERLRARAWIEGPDGRLLAVAADRCSP